MSQFLEILKCVLCCVEEEEEDNDDIYYEPLDSCSSNLSNCVSRFISSVERLFNRLRRSNKSYTATYVPVRSYDPLASSSIPTSSRPKPLTTSSSNQSQSLRIPATSSSNPSPLPPPSSTSSSKHSPQVVISSSSSSRPSPLPSSNQSHSLHIPGTSSSNPSPLPPPSSTSSSKHSPQFVISSSSSRPSPLPSSNQSHSLHIPAISSNTSPLPPPPSTSSSERSSQVVIPSSSSRPSLLPTFSSSKLSLQAPTPTFQPSTPLPKLTTISHLKPPSPLPQPQTSSSKPSPSAPKASASSPGQPPSSSKQLPTFKPTLSQASSSLVNQQSKVSYLCVQKGTSPIYAIPKNIEELIKRDKVPEVLRKPLSPSTYKDYFAALLYAEDFYIEKWSEFKLENITLKLQDAEIIKRSGWNKQFSQSFEKDDKTFVEFKIDAAREKRPFLLSRDFVFARPSVGKTEPFQGIIYRVVKSNRVLVEFGEDFHSQHRPTRKYDVSFSFNRFCLKRAHQAIEAASDPLFISFIFPHGVPRKIVKASSSLSFCNHNLDMYQSSAVREILSVRGSPPFLLEGPLCIITKKSSPNARQLSRTGLVVQEAVLKLYQSSSKHRILICAPINGTCDFLMQRLRNEILESDMFRANAAFREVDGVPFDIFPSCHYKGECFTCPPLQELRKFRIILSTYVSSFRLHNEGITACHFSHIFLVDASSATEPEVMVTLANLASEEAAVIVTGSPGNHSGWVRSKIARENGLKISYFERLRDSNPYGSLDPKFIRQLVDPEAERKSDDTYSFESYSYGYDSLFD